MKSARLKNIVSLLVCVLFVAFSFYTGDKATKWQSKSILTWDVSGYHLYLPAAIIYRDITDYSFYNNIDDQYHPSHNGTYYGIDKHPVTGHRVNKYSLGVAIFELPCFLVANVYCKISAVVPNDGYSPPFQLAVFCSTLLFVFLGLLILRRFLLTCGFKDLTVAITLAILSFGTNLFSYTAYQPGMGHPYSFFLYACILLLTLQLYKNYQLKTFLLLGLSIGLAILIRPIDIFVVIIPLLWPLKTFTATYSLLFSKYKLYILAAIVMVLVPWIPQILYWKYTAGDFIYYSYANEGFNFTNPQILKGLFSYRKGWFIYTPLAFIGIISLILLLWNKRFKNYAITCLLFYAISFWVIFSWHQWYYGGSFGSRVMINSLPLLAIPLCAIIEQIYNKHLVIKILSTVIFPFFIYLNLFQCKQYNQAIIHWDSMNKEYYWRVFLKKEVSEEDKKLL